HLSAHRKRGRKPRRRGIREALYRRARGTGIFGAGIELALHRIRAAVSGAARRAGNLGSGYACFGAAFARGGGAARRGGHRRDVWGKIGGGGPRDSHHGGPGTGKPRYLREEIRLVSRLNRSCCADPREAI